MAVIRAVYLLLLFMVSANAQSGPNGGIIGVGGKQVINVLQYGADPTGGSDSSASFNSAISGLPLNGGIVQVPCGTYKIASTVTIGNGSNTAASTRVGIRIIGAGGKKSQLTNTCVTINWAGSSGGTVFSVLGPIEGIELSNMTVSGGGIGLSLVSVSESQFWNLSFLQPTTEAILLSTIQGTNSTGVYGGDAHDDFRDISIATYLTASASGIVLNGNPTAGIDPTANIFENISIQYNGGSGSYGFHLLYDDHNTFTQIHFPGASDSNTGGCDIFVDETGGGGSGFPEQDLFIGMTDAAAPCESGTPGSTSFIGYDISNGASLPSAFSATGQATTFGFWGITIDGVAFGRQWTTSLTWSPISGQSGSEQNFSAKGAKANQAVICSPEGNAPALGNTGLTWQASTGGSDNNIVIQVDNVTSGSLTPSTVTWTCAQP